LGRVKGKAREFLVNPLKRGDGSPVESGLLSPLD